MCNRLRTFNAKIVTGGNDLSMQLKGYAKFIFCLVVLMYLFWHSISDLFIIKLVLQAFFVFSLRPYLRDQIFL